MSVEKVFLPRKPKEPEFKLKPLIKRENPEEMSSGIEIEQRIALIFSEVLELKGRVKKLEIEVIKLGGKIK